LGGGNAGDREVTQSTDPSPIVSRRRGAGGGSGRKRDNSKEGGGEGVKGGGSISTHSENWSAESSKGGDRGGKRCLKYEEKKKKNCLRLSFNTTIRKE